MCGNVMGLLRSFRAAEWVTSSGNSTPTHSPGVVGMFLPGEPHKLSLFEFH